MEQPNSSLSTDALPMQPRQPDGPEVVLAEQIPESSNDSNEATDPTTVEDFEEIPEPHPDWQFNLFLDQIADDITGEEFDQLKHLFRGYGGIGDSTLNEMRTVRDLFTIMRSRNLLTRENLLYLHSILNRIGRVDLIKKGVKYANTTGNVIHCYPASALPENGYQFVKFHVEGRNFRSCTRGYIQNLRSIIANILFIPAEFVIIAGVEPSSSLLITLMLPERYVSILEDLLEDHSCTTDMKELGIDFVEIDKVYNVEDEKCTEVSDNDQQKMFANLYQQLEMKTKQLEDSETERLRIAGQIQDYRSKLSELEEKHCKDEILIMTLKASAVESPDRPEPFTSVSKKAMQDFECALEKVGRIDKDDIQTLLSTNTSVVANRLTEKFSIRQRQFELALNDLQSQILPLQFEIQKLKFFFPIDINELDKMLLESFKKLMQSIANEVSTIQVELNEEVLQILKKISILLRPRERESLKKKYTWDSDDQLKHTINTDRSLLLACLLLKEINLTQKLVDVESFISRCLEEVGRRDLAKKIHDFFGCKSQTDGKPKKKQNTSRRRSESLSRTPEGENRGPLADQSQILNKVAEQVQEIHDAIKMTKEEFPQDVRFHKGFGLSYDPPPYTPFC